MSERKSNKGCAGCLSLIFAPVKLLADVTVSIVRWLSSQKLTLPIGGGTTFSLLGIVVALGLVCVSCSLLYTWVDTGFRQAGLLPTYTPVPTSTPRPTKTPKPTHTPAPTNTLKPTPLPLPTATPVPPTATQVLATQPPPTEPPQPTAVPTEPPQPTDLPLPTVSPAEAPTAPGDVEITYIYYNGQVPRVESDEYAVIKNAGGSPINLGGWRLNAGNPGQDFGFPDFMLQPGQECRVYTNEHHPEWCGFSFGKNEALWLNKGDCGHLYDASGAEVSTYCY
jgi:hypothetical protein